MIEPYEQKGTEPSHPSSISFIHDNLLWCDEFHSVFMNTVGGEIFDDEI